MASPTRTKSALSHAHKADVVVTAPSLRKELESVCQLFIETLDNLAADLRQHVEAELSSTKTSLADFTSEQHKEAAQTEVHHKQALQSLRHELATQIAQLPRCVESLTHQVQACTDRFSAAESKCDRDIANLAQQYETPQRRPQQDRRCPAPVPILHGPTPGTCRSTNRGACTSASQLAQTLTLQRQSTESLTLAVQQITGQLRHTQLVTQSRTIAATWRSCWSRLRLAFCPAAGRKVITSAFHRLSGVHKRSAK